MLEQLLVDQIKSARGPVEFVIAYAPTEPMKYLLEFAHQEEHRVEVIVQEGEVKGVAQTTKAQDPVGPLIKRLVKASKPRLLVFWDESATVRRAVSQALDSSIEVRDLCDALTRLGSLTTKESNNVPKIHTRPDLEAMDEDELEALAESYNIDHGSYDSWEPVIEQILEAQAGDEPSLDAEEAAMPGGDGDDEEFVPYTREELEAMDIARLKEIVATNELTVEGKRPRASAYVEAILVAQEAALDDGEAPEPEPAPKTRKVSRGVEEVAAPGIPQVDLAPVTDLVEQVLEAVTASGKTVLAVADGVEGLTAALEAVEARLGAIEERLAPPAPSTDRVAPVARPVKKAALKRV